MSKRFGYHQQYLHVDLTERQSRAVLLDGETLRSFLGGSGLGVYLLLKMGAAQCDPTSPDAPIAFVFSPLVGSLLTMSAKFAVVSKSPLTNRFNDSLASSGFAVAGKRTGNDAIVITGCAAEPSILVIDDGDARIEPAGDLWGATCSETQRRLGEQFGGQWESAVIGPAGEQQVRYATISHDGRHAGRGGSGAVLGSKNIKAIVVRGTQKCEWAHADELTRYAKQLSKRSFGPATEKYRELGTGTNLLTFNRLNALPTRNFQFGSFAAAEQIAPETLLAERSKVQQSCVACTIGCEHIYALNADETADASTGVRLEYENLFALGSLCAVSDSDAVLAASKQCDELGLDTISAGGTIAFAMECVERGLLEESWLKFGDGNALLRAIELVGRREGFGDALAEGSFRLAEQIGGDSVAFAAQVKGMEIPGYEPRALQTMALGFAVGSRGADHNRSGAYEADFSDKVDRRSLSRQSAALAIESEDKAALMDSLILCRFLRGVFDDFCDEASLMLNLVTGWDTTANELRETSRRIVTAKKLFNIRAGWTPDEDTLPQRFLENELPDDRAAKLDRERLCRAVQQYNLGRGWQSDGFVDPSRLEGLGLDEL